MKPPHFYAVIIGTEILNGRRTDRHFEFLKQALERFGHTLFASLVLKDDVHLITSIFDTVRRDPDAVMFSFGGIGSTPDDLTRMIAAKVFTGKPLMRHKQFEHDIIERFKEEAYPYRIHMADLPEGAELLKNPINNMSGFSLQSRYFFVPGFPQMAHPMITEVIERFFSQSAILIRKTLLADTSENTLIEVMQQMPKSVEFSSLPLFRDGKPHVEISVAGSDAEEVERHFMRFTSFLEYAGIPFTLLS